MSSRKSNRVTFPNENGPLRLGFLPENDCAPIVMAQELGLFKKYDLCIVLQREMSWKNLQDKIIGGQLDAAAAPAALAFLINLGLAPEKCSCVSAMVLSLQGNAITISHALWDRGVRNAQ